MSDNLRYLLLAAALITAVWILRKIRKTKVKMEDAIFWIVVAMLLAVMGLFPELTYRISAKIGMLSPANLIFLVVIFLLLEKVFTLSIIVSQLEDKVTMLSAELAIRTHASKTDVNRGGLTEADADMDLPDASGENMDGKSISGPLRPIATGYGDDVQRTEN